MQQTVPQLLLSSENGHFDGAEPPKSHLEARIHQIQIQNSESVLVYNNTVVVGPRRGNGLAIQQQNRTQCASLVAGSPFHVARHNTFDSNRVYYAVSCADPSSTAWLRAVRGRARLRAPGPISMP